MNMMFNSERFISAWDKWKLYKKQQHNFTFKGDISEQGAIKKLHRISGSNEGLALLIIEQSIENGWTGLFTLKTPPETKKKLIPIHKEKETTEIAPPEVAEKHIAEIKATLRRTGGIGKANPKPEYDLPRRFRLFKNYEHICPISTKEKLLAELKEFPDKYEEEIKYMER